MLHHLGGDERLKRDACNAVVVGETLLISAEQVRKQPTVGDVDLGGVQHPFEKARPPCGDGAHEEDRFEQPDITLHRLLVEFELACEGGIAKQVARARGQHR